MSCLVCAAYLFCVAIAILIDIVRSIVSSAFPFFAPLVLAAIAVRAVVRAGRRVEGALARDAEPARDDLGARPPVGERPPPSPVIACGDGPGEGDLHVELALDDTCFAPGESITGAFAVGNIGSNRLHGATIALVAPGCESRADSEVSVFKSLAGVADGRVVRFSLPVPAACSFPADAVALVELHVDGSRVACAAPVVVDAFTPRAGALPETPRIGRARWRSAWREKGARLGLVLDAWDLGLRGVLAGGIEARVTPFGNALQATLRWESLGLGLSVGPRSPVPASNAFERLHPRFAARFLARGYDAVQVAGAIGPRLRSALLAFDEAKLDDAGARLVAVASARDPEALRRFLAALAELAGAVAAAERQAPPPSWVEPSAAAAWRAFAAATGGTLHPGRMAVTGALVDGVLVHVDTRLDPRGRPLATRVTLPATLPADRVSRLPRGAYAALVRSAPARRLAPRVELRADAVQLEIHGPTASPADLEDAIREMAALARAVTGATTRGPYR